MKVEGLVKSPNFKHTGGGQFEMNLIVKVVGGDSNDIIKLLSLTGQQIEFEPKLIAGNLDDPNQIPIDYQFDQATPVVEEPENDVEKVLEQVSEELIREVGQNFREEENEK